MAPLASINAAQLAQELLALLAVPLSRADLSQSVASIIGKGLKLDACWLRSNDNVAGQWLRSEELTFEHTCFVAPCSADNQTEFKVQGSTGKPWIVLHLPVQLRQENLGCLSIVYEESYDSQVRVALKRLLSNVAILLSHHALEEQVVEHQQRYSQLITRIGEAFQPPQKSTSQLTEIILDAACHALGVDQGVVIKFKYDTPGSSLSARSTSEFSVPSGSVEVDLNWPNPLPTAQSAPHPISSNSVCVQTWSNFPAPFVLATEQEWRRFLDAPQTTPFLNPASKSLLAVPILGSDSARGRLLAIIIWVQNQYRTWHLDDFKLGEWIAGQLGMTLLHSHTLERVQTLVDERTAQLKLLLGVQEKLADKMKRQIKELERARDIQDEFIGNLSDALRHPLTKIKIATSLLKIAPTDDKRNHYLDIVSAECEKEINLVNDLLALHSLESGQGQFQFQLFDLKELMEEIKVILADVLQVRSLTLGYSFERVGHKTPSVDSLPIDSDRDTLRRILLELINNACKFAQTKTQVEVEIFERKLDQGRRLELNVIDWGAGISESDSKIIFNKFQRGENAASGSLQGTGLGLALVKSLVEHLGGEIFVESQLIESGECFKTIFRVFLPQT
ncbi:MAG: ATP-binding protein [Cyanobacteria bacterium P01_H01_bin.15]